MFACRSAIAGSDRQLPFITLSWAYSINESLRVPDSRNDAQNSAAYYCEMPPLNTTSCNLQLEITRCGISNREKCAVFGSKSFVLDILTEKGGGGVSMRSARLEQGDKNWPARLSRPRNGGDYVIDLQG